MVSVQDKHSQEPVWPACEFLKGSNAVSWRFLYRNLSKVDFELPAIV